MAMDMPGMSGMSGMDMSSAAMFTPTNKRIAHIYWYLVAAVVGLLVFTRTVDRLRLLYVLVLRSATAEMERANDNNRSRISQRRLDALPFRPETPWAQSYDTLIAVCRELAYYQIWTFTGKWSRYFTPPSLGKCLLLVIYWTVILTMLWSNTILSSSSPNYAYRWEIVGFRAAWVSVTQLPLIYVLSGKFNVISILTGISYERLNWLHRWIARTMFLTVIVHWSFFFREWDLAHFVKLEMDMMPMVNYGFGAWAVLGWMVLTGFGFFRSACYEIWILQHLAAAAVLLWLVYIHVPFYAQYNVWFAVGVVAVDTLFRTLRTVYINLHLSPRATCSNQPRRKGRIGYEAEVKCLSSDICHVTVRGVDFSWRPGQHVYLTIPRAGLFEAHPFTIANVSKKGSQYEELDCLELYIRVHQGFTRRLHRRCRDLQSTSTFLSFISGPWGIPTSTDRFESLVFLATGNGASFTLPTLQQALMTETHLRQILFVWVIPYSHQLDWFRKRLSMASRSARLRHINISIRVYITRKIRDSNLLASEDNPLLEANYEMMPKREELVNNDSQGAALGTEPASLSSEDDPGCGGKEESSLWSSSASNEPPSIIMGTGRPDVDSLIRPVVEEAWGETGIYACGGAQFTGSIRNYVARLSDERAVHKGTGAQGLFLFCETYGW